MRLGRRREAADGPVRTVRVPVQVLVPECDRYVTAGRQAELGDLVTDLRVRMLDAAMGRR
jgi:hypothetical protein